MRRLRRHGRGQQFDDFSFLLCAEKLRDVVCAYVDPAGDLDDRACPVGVTQCRHLGRFHLVVLPGSVVHQIVEVIAHVAESEFSPKKRKLLN
jgi:hypothetical protein